jgi:hypothetical protein
MHEAWQRVIGPDVVGAFYRELIAFHQMITGERPAPTTLGEAVCDIAACEALGRAATAGREVAVDDAPVVGGAEGPLHGDGSARKGSG